MDFNQYPIFHRDQGIDASCLIEIFVRADIFPATFSTCTPLTHSLPYYSSSSRETEHCKGCGPLIGGPAFLTHSYHSLS